MRPIRVLCIVLRLLLLLSAPLAFYLITYNYLQSSAPIASKPSDSPSSSPGMESHLDPASLLLSIASEPIEERLRVMAYQRLSQKLAGYATASSGFSSSNSRPQTTQTRPSSQAVSINISSSIPTRPESREAHTPHNHQNQTRGESKDDSQTSEGTSLPPDLHATTNTGQSLHSRDVPSPHISHDFHWPQPHAVRPTRELLREQWVVDLHSSLSEMTSHEVTLLTSNQQYTEVICNSVHLSL